MEDAGVDALAVPTTPIIAPLIGQEAIQQMEKAGESPDTVIGLDRSPERIVSACRDSVRIGDTTDFESVRDSSSAMTASIAAANMRCSRSGSVRSAIAASRDRSPVRPGGSKALPKITAERAWLRAAADSCCSSAWSGTASRARSTGSGTAARSGRQGAPSMAWYRGLTR